MLIGQARAAAARGDHATAASLAERALAIESTPSLRLFLAEQWIGLGRDVEALAQVERCRREANPDRRQESLVRGNCDVLRRSLVERLAVLQLRVEPGGSVAQANNQSVPTDGSPVAVPMGSVALRVSLSGFQPYQEVLSLARGETREVSVALRALLPIEPSAPIAPPAVLPSPTASPQARPPSSRLPPIGSVVWMASGALLLAAVTPLLLWQRDELASRCARSVDDDLICPDDNALGAARTANEVLHPAAVAAGVLGGISVVVGACLWWRSARAAAPPRQVSLLPGPRGAALSLSF